MMIEVLLQNKFVFEDEVYYVSHDTVYDSTFCAVPFGEAEKVLHAYFAAYLDKIKDRKPKMPSYTGYIIEMKRFNLYGECLKAIEDGLKEFSTSNKFKREVFPIATSCYRLLNQPKKAIEFYEKHKHNRLSYSDALFTSLAAAYCDVEDYETARRYLNEAKFFHSGKPDEEWLYVYNRVKSHT